MSKTHKIIFKRKLKKKLTIKKKNNKKNRITKTTKKKPLVKTRKFRRKMQGGDDTLRKLIKNKINFFKRNQRKALAQVATQEEISDLAKPTSIPPFDETVKKQLKDLKIRILTSDGNPSITTYITAAKLKVATEGLSSLRRDSQADRQGFGIFKVLKEAQQQTKNEAAVAAVAAAVAAVAAADSAVVELKAKMTAAIEPVEKKQLEVELSSAQKMLNNAQLQAEAAAAAAEEAKALEKEDVPVAPMARARSSINDLIGIYATKSPTDNLINILCNHISEGGRTTAGQVYKKFFKITGKNLPTFTTQIRKASKYAHKRLITYINNTIGNTPLDWVETAGTLVTLNSLFDSFADTFINYINIYLQKPLKISKWISITTALDFGLSTNIINFIINEYVTHNVRFFNKIKPLFKFYFVLTLTHSSYKEIKEFFG